MAAGVRPTHLTDSSHRTSQKADSSVPRTAIFQQLLRQRGLSAGFLDPKYEDLPDPSALPDLAPALTRIQAAIVAQENIVIYGDYDVDGVCTSVVLRDGLILAGVRPDRVHIILPDRFTDGYGLNLSAIPPITDHQATLVITVDCGSGSQMVIRTLKGQGIDTVVTDHHELKTPPRAAIATINPKRQKSNPFRDLAGAGVAFMLALALCRDFDSTRLATTGPSLANQAKWLLDLVAIATICDSVPLTGTNRTLAYWGMRVLAQTRRPGLRELMKLAQIDPTKLNTHAVAFQIGPRLNAGGRMDSATRALDLLVATSKPQAFQLATQLDQLNQDRRNAQESAATEIATLGVSSNPVIVVRGRWHEGVIGIIASQLVERYQRPAFALTELADGSLKGSGRSFGDFHLADCLAACQSCLAAGGGHNYACGLSLANDRYDDFVTAVNNYYRSLHLCNQTRFLKPQPDLDTTNFADLTEELYQDLQLLEPFGEANPEPIFSTTAQLFTIKILKEKHLALTLRDSSGRFLRLIAFSAPAEWLDLARPGQDLDDPITLRVAFTLTLNSWNGQNTVEGRLLDLTVV